MTLEQLRAALAAALAAVVAFAVAASVSCARERVRHDATFVAARQLGESTASPGADPSKPVARSVDTREVSATIRRLPEGPPPAGPVAPPPQNQPAPPPPADTGSPGVFAPPPPPPPP